MGTQRQVRERRRPARNPLQAAPAGLTVGYARTSTLDQAAGFEAQLRDLAAAGAVKLFQEQVSSVGTRPQLAACLDYIREGDVLIVTRLDRLARSTAHLLEIVKTIETKRAALRILDLNVDTATATGRLLLTMIGAVAEFERRLMLERQKEGVQKAKLAGKYKGRAPTARRKSTEIEMLKSQGLGATEIARVLGIGRASVYRILNENRASLARD